MTRRMKCRFLVTAASVVASVSFASAQGLSGGGAANEKGTSAGQAGMSQSSVATVNLPSHDIRVVQRALIERGFLHGKADGILGPKTRKAISAFQRQQGVQVTGSIDARTISSLGVSGRLSQHANQSIGQSQPLPKGAQSSMTDHGQAGAAVELSSDDIRVVQRVLIERSLLHGKADGVLGPKTREAISAFQRQQGIQVTGSIDARTVSSLGVSDRLSQQVDQNSQQVDQSIGQSQSSPTGAQTSKTGHGQAGTGQVQTGQPQPSQQNATGQASNQTTGQAIHPPAQQSQPTTTTGQSTAPNQSNATVQTVPHPQSGNKPIANENVPSGAISLTFTSAAVGFILLALGGFILMPAI